jgi:hypothetical protein
MIKLIFWIAVICVGIAHWQWAVGLVVLWVAVKVCVKRSENKRASRIPRELLEKAPIEIKDKYPGAEVPGGYAKFIEQVKPLVYGIAFPSTSPGAPGRKSPYNQIEARAVLQDYLDSVGYVPPAGKKGTIHDLSSNKRLDMILGTNADLWSGYRQWLSQRGYHIDQPVRLK